MLFWQKYQDVYDKRKYYVYSEKQEQRNERKNDFNQLAFSGEV